MNLYNEYMKLSDQEKDELARRIFLERCNERSTEKNQGGEKK